MRSLAVMMALLAGGIGIFLYANSTPPVVVPAVITAPSSSPSLEQGYILQQTNPSYAPVRDTSVADPIVDANTAAVYHLESQQELWTKNPSMQVPVASLTKLLSALVVSDLFVSEEVVEVSSSSLRVDGQKQTLFEGELLTVQSLLTMMLVESSNDAAFALAAHAAEKEIDFVSEMNAKAWAIGMRGCAFRDPAGLDDTGYCNVRDLLRLARVVLLQYPQLLPVMTQQTTQVVSVDQAVVHEIENTNELLDDVPGILGGKTGYTDGALGCLILITSTNGQRDTILTVVLGSAQRFTDTRMLLDWTQQAFLW